MKVKVLNLNLKKPKIEEQVELGLSDSCSAKAMLRQFNKITLKRYRTI
eukprot:CAMPEP_0170482978 /NCGR_PEP_ID=MMETSP0208-20121228/2758_1 /TAXON_ID=197538 /ORGANISM="Strombidium inclinatum, Strain S3" /LENGTH=47 /DNA_ID= /DNA_START= /DNA_END= /DNA_ORIENTATION=